MNANTPSYRRLWLPVLALLAVSAASTGWILHYSTPGGGCAEEGEKDAAALPGAQDVVCFGHVDLEHGVTSLYPLQPGRVAEVLVRENEAVAAGAVLLRLDGRAARTRCDEARAALEAAEIRLAQAEKLPDQHRTRLAQQQAAIEAVRQRLSAARRLLVRKQELLAAQHLSAEEVAAAADQIKEVEALERAEQGKLAELQLNDPALEMRRARAEVAAIQARLEEARLALDECQLKAPKAGTVLRILVNPGDVLSGQPKQPAVLFCPHGPRLIRAEVDQEFAGRVAAGQAARIEDDASLGATWRGQVARLSDWYTQRRSTLLEPLQFNDVRTLECLIAVDPGQKPLRIGQRVRVTIKAQGSE
jgi:multidrug resistance efflux pump